MSNKRYRLLKDLPDCNFGDIILYDDYAKEYYIKTKGDSRIYFQESTVENNPEWFIEEHLCKYCGSFTSQTDEQCYLYPKPKEELKEPERVGGKEKMHQWFLKWKGKKIYQYTQEQVNKMMEDAATGFTHYLEFIMDEDDWLKDDGDGMKSMPEVYNDFTQWKNSKKSSLK